MLKMVPCNGERVEYTGNRLGPISLVGIFLLNARVMKSLKSTTDGFVIYINFCTW